MKRRDYENYKKMRLFDESQLFLIAFHNKYGFNIEDSIIRSIDSTERNRTHPNIYEYVSDFLNKYYEEHYELLHHQKELKVIFEYYIQHK